MASSEQVHVVDAVIKDHKHIDAYYKQYRANEGNPPEQQKWANQLFWQIAVHSIAEELTVYPAFEQYVPDGVAIAEKERSQHQQVKDDLYQLQNKSVGQDADFVPLMEKMMNELTEHIQQEETTDMPKLREAISNDDALRLGRDFEMTKYFVPTRSHPSAPNKPPFETVAGLLAAPIDRLRDLLTKFPSEQELKAVEP
ncbi:uncharacterized protein SPPG_07733 [Spizellomyces punctatus DAOM BR117]|uniref:Hemerythrin-like domain-containing protein n=1 Tax=Spizellomyces punctatus (strain DAOM BR117) TaxID=645134 RepID=A0A0L0H6P2_SPIPD|nr:uncharacterized protein SPPG_07733 [Spizellomyces punctatus DAOM BR117]KNC96907.1 hypothetical protein SPPG_07733 [Spizellomyces punctatus DAOM BR117]|eukprot:XP_016604947.1 hypothetical protein SPPG_07733 [Spizellomyces punctatus DAOM BR117]